MTRLTIPQVRDTTQAALEIHALLQEAGVAQWQKSRIVTPDGDTQDDPGIKGKGTVSDPTADTVSDPRRLALRAAVLQAEQALAAGHHSMIAAAAQLQTALDRWNGGI